MFKAMVRFRLLGIVIVLGLLTAIGCKEKAPVGVLMEFETPAWADKEGALIVKTEAPESNVLLMRRRDPGIGYAELFGEIKIEHDFEAGEVIYRYDPNVFSKELEAVDLRTWVEATGPEWWDEQQVRRVPSRLKVGLASGELGFGPHKVPTEGPIIMHMAQSMYAGSPRVAILSAHQKRLTYQDAKAGNPPKLEKFYHQVFDTKELKPVGVPIPLSFETDDAPKCVWAGRDSYVVYTDMLHKKVQIVHMYRMPSGEE